MLPKAALALNLKLSICCLFVLILTFRKFIIY